MNSSAQKAAANGLIGMVLVYAVFTGWMVVEVYSGMSGEELVWMVVLPVPFVMILFMLGSLAVSLGLSFHRKSTATKMAFVTLAFVLQIVLFALVGKLDFSDDGTSSPILPFGIGSLLLWVIAMVTHSFIHDYELNREDKEDQGSD